MTIVIKEYGYATKVTKLFLKLIQQKAKLLFGNTFDFQFSS